MNITITAEVVAWYGAIVGTGSLVVSGFNAWRDRVRVRVSARPGYKVSGAGAGYSPDKSYISVTVANTGRRPVTISAVWFDTDDPKHSHRHLLLSDGFLKGPRELGEGKSTTYYMDQSDLDLKKLKRVVAADQTGREWSAKFEV